MARLLVVDKAGTHTAEITETDVYRWTCTCGQAIGRTRRLADAIEYASQHVDNARA